MAKNPAASFPSNASNRVASFRGGASTAPSDSATSRHSVAAIRSHDCPESDSSSSSRVRRRVIFVLSVIVFAV